MTFKEGKVIAMLNIVSLTDNINEQLILFALQKIYREKPTISQTTIQRAMISAHCVVCNSRKQVLTYMFIKEQQAKGFLNCLRLNTPLSKVPILGAILFDYVKYNYE